MDGQDVRSNVSLARSQHSCNRSQEGRNTALTCGVFVYDTGGCSGQLSSERVGLSA
jgi:hypothetical protein